MGLRSGRRRSRAGDITNWTELPWDDDLSAHRSRQHVEPSPPGSRPPANNVIIGFRAWKKWGTAQRELNVNLDAIRLSGCPGGVPPTWPPKHPHPDPKPLPVCVHVVARGETLGRIAAHHNTTVQALARANHIANPNVIYVGQKLIVPCEGRTLTPPVVVVQPKPPVKPVVVVVEKPVVVVEQPAAPPAAARSAGMQRMAHRGAGRHPEQGRGQVWFICGCAHQGEQPGQPECDLRRPEAVHRELTLP